MMRALYAMFCAVTVSCGGGEQRAADSDVDAPVDASDADRDVDTGSGSDTGGDSDSTDGGRIDADFHPTTGCTDVCSDGLANPSDGCGSCLLTAQVSACLPAYQACNLDASTGGETCVRCLDFLNRCSTARCPDVAQLCPPSRVLLDALNSCLCDTCGGDHGGAPAPGFMYCTRPELPDSECVGLSKRACTETPGCRAVFSDPCPGAEDCAPYARFARCLAAEGEPETGACNTLSAVSCATRDDCIAVHEKDHSRCCPQPSWTMPFLECRSEPAAPAEPPFECIGARSLGACLELDECTPVFNAGNGLCGCGPYLCSASSCRPCWNYEYTMCMDSWRL